MSILQHVVLGLVQGLAEFLPISSSGHLILARAFMGISEATVETQAYLMLDILLHVGTLIAVVVVFWRDWIDILKNPFKSKTLLMLFIASLPALLVAVLFKDVLDSFFSGWFLGVSFLVTAVFLLIAEHVSKRAKQGTEKVGLKHAIVMGIMQGIALLPGISRSGSTLTGGLSSGLTRKAAAKFSFMMSAPAILGSLLIEGKNAYEQNAFSQLNLLPIVLAMVVAAISGYLAIRFMLRLIEKTSLTWFALYVAFAGLVVLVIQFSGSNLLPAFEIPVL